MNIPLDQYRRNQQTEEAEQLQREYELQLKIEKAEAAEKYAKLEVLCNNPEFQWFIGECVKPLADSTQGEALDIRRTPDERNDKCQQHFMARQIVEMAWSMKEQAKNEAGHFEQQ